MSRLGSLGKCAETSAFSSHPPPCIFVLDPSWPVDMARAYVFGALILASGEALRTHCLIKPGVIPGLSKSSDFQLLSNYFDQTKTGSVVTRLRGGSSDVWVPSATAAWTLLTVCIGLEVNI